jgi:hypothetical protein
MSKNQGVLKTLFFNALEFKNNNCAKGGEGLG